MCRVHAVFHRQSCVIIPLKPTVRITIVIIFRAPSAVPLKVVIIQNAVKTRRRRVLESFQYFQVFAESLLNYVPKSNARTRLLTIINGVNKYDFFYDIRYSLPILKSTDLSVENPISFFF